MRVFADLMPRRKPGDWFRLRRCAALVGLLAVAGCKTVTTPAAPTAPIVQVGGDDTVVEAQAVATSTEVKPGTPLARSGDEIMVAGQLFHTGTPVVLWTDPGGFDGYRVERRFSAPERADWTSSVKDNPELSTPNRFGQRNAVLSPAEQAVVRGGGWPLALLQRVVDQFVLHYDASGTSARCFERLHDQRGLSIHFMLDVDGTIYQTLDLKERAWHATQANSRSIGIEIANLGAYPVGPDKVLAQWYRRDPTDGSVTMVIPTEAHPEMVRTPRFVARPDRPDVIAGTINGSLVRQYDFTPEQYAALIRLTASLCTIFPNLRPDYPHTADGAVIPQVLAEDTLKTFGGVLGHFHIQANKVDPGPALQWPRVLNGARALMGLPPIKTGPAAALQ